MSALEERSSLCGSHRDVQNVRNMCDIMLEKFRDSRLFNFFCVCLSVYVDVNLNGLLIGWWIFGLGIGNVRFMFAFYKTLQQHPIACFECETRAKRSDKMRHRTWKHHTLIQSNSLKLNHPSHTLTPPPIPHHPHTNSIIKRICSIRTAKLCCE